MFCKIQRQSRQSRKSWKSFNYNVGPQKNVCHAGAIYEFIMEGAKSMNNINLNHFWSASCIGVIGNMCRGTTCESITDIVGFLPFIIFLLDIIFPHPVEYCSSQRQWNGIARHTLLLVLDELGRFGIEPFKSIVINLQFFAGELSVHREIPKGKEKACYFGSLPGHFWWLQADHNKGAGDHVQKDYFCHCQKQRSKSKR